MATKATRYCGRTFITITRREDGAGYDCNVSEGGRGNGWSGVVELPIGLDDGGSPPMFDQIAKMAASQAVAAGYETRLSLDTRDSGYVIRRRYDFDSRLY